MVGLFVMRNKRGWMRILEATIAVMIVAGVLIVVYSRQDSGRVSSVDYFYNLQKQILKDVSSSSALRLAILRTDVGERNEYFFRVNDFIADRIPDSFGYLIRICEFGTVCKIDNVDVIRATRDKDVFVEEIVISSDLGDGSGGHIYNPKKLRLFVWEGYREDTTGEPDVPWSLFGGNDCELSDGDWRNFKFDAKTGDYIIEFDVTLTHGSNDPAGYVYLSDGPVMNDVAIEAAIYFYFKNDNSGSNLEIRGQDGLSEEIHYDVGTWYHIKIEVRNSHYWIEFSDGVDIQPYGPYALGSPISNLGIGDAFADNIEICDPVGFEEPVVGP